MKKIFTILLVLFFWLNAESQTYNPTQHTVTNKALGIAQQTPTDARTMYFDAVNFTYRQYQNTTEVLTYLNLPKYRYGGFDIVVNTGGILSGGLITGGINEIFFFKNGVADSNLVRKIPTVTSGTGTLTNITATNGNGLAWTITNPTINPNLLLALTYGGDVSGVTNNLVVNRFNGQLPSYYLNYNNLFNTPTIPAQLNPSCVGCNITGTYPNYLWTITGSGFNTAGVYLKAINPSTVAIDTLNYRKQDTSYMINDSTMIITINSRPDTLSIRGGVGGGGGGSGTVFNVAGTNANGIIWSISNPTSNVNMTISLGNIIPITVNGLTLAPLTNGFAITGGTTPATLTVPSNANVSGTNTGDATNAGENYLTRTGQLFTANPVNVSNTNITGILKASAFPAMLGDVTNSAGSLTNSIIANGVTYAKLQQNPAFSIIGNSQVSTANNRALFPKYGILFDTDSLKVDTILLKNIFGSSSILQFTSGSGTTLIGDGGGVNPYHYDLGGALTQDANIDGNFNILVGTVIPLDNFNLIASAIQLNADQIHIQSTGLGDTFIVDGTGIHLNANTDLTAPLKIADGTQAAGYIFTSDATGAGSWQPNSTADAVNGLSISSSKVVLGQNVGQVGSPASLSSIREIPLNGFSVSFLTSTGGKLYVGEEGFGSSPSWHSTGLFTLLSDINNFAYGGLGGGFENYPIIELANGFGTTNTRYAGVIGGYSASTLFKGDLLLTTYANSSPALALGGNIILRPGTNVSVLGDPTFETQYGNNSIIVEPSGTGSFIDSGRAIILDTLRTPNIILKSPDTTNYKLNVVDALGNHFKMNWQTGGGGAGGNFVGYDSVLTITSGTSSTVTNGYNVIRFNPASVMATYTLTLPTTWHTSNDLLISFGGTITSGNPVVTTLTIVNGSGQTLLQAVTPNTANAGEIIRYHLIGTINQRTQ